MKRDLALDIGIALLIGLGVFALAVVIIERYQ